MIKTIKLSKLKPSPRNVRRSSDEQADLQLKADIEARGLLQNLVVAPARKPRGSFDVEAGCRRLRALKALAAEGKLASDHAVSCLVIESGPADAHEAGLAENFQRLAMNPADECLAFGQLIEQGADPEQIARRFGLSIRFVEGRLRLANLAPVVFAALGAGEITLDVAKAYAATADRERQAHVFDQVSRSYMAQHPDSIRRMMTQATLSASDRRARFVGEEAYLAEGGRIERDLFSDDDDARWLDTALLERLANEKLESIAAEIATSIGLAFVRPTLDSWLSSDLRHGLERVELERLPLSDAEAAEVDALEAEREELFYQIEDERTPDDLREAAEARLRAVNDRTNGILDKPPAVPDHLKGRVGTFLLLGEDGEPRLHPSYYSELSNETGRGMDDAQGLGQAAVALPERSRRSAGLPQRLADELAIQRRDILAVHIAADRRLALDLAIFLMIDREPGYSWEKSGSSLSALPPTDPVVGFKTPDSAATRAREEAAEALDGSWRTADTRAARFDAFRNLSSDARSAWLGHAIGCTLEASLNLPGGRSCAFHDHLGRLLGIEVAKWWRPTGSNFFDRVPKSVTLAALEEVGGEAFAARYSKAKKGELAEAAERIFAGTLIAEAEVRERALAWLPEVMRFAEPPLSDPEEETPPWEEGPAGSQDCPCPDEVTTEGAGQTDGKEQPSELSEAA